ncbi:MAG TPA: hypothetical protein ENH23_04240 [candidate division Zixibacteria bacterium]|nr:hypothetical protein [candidate division Zixibacteria bacterium]
MMRSAKFFTILGFVLLASMSLLFVGCGSDDGPTTITGSLTNPDFVVVQDQVETIVDSTLDFVLTGMNSLSSISTDGIIIPNFYGPVFSDSDQVTIAYVGGWYVVNAVQQRSDFAFTVLDSVQFYINDEVSQNGVGADSMWYRHRWSYDVADTTVSYTKVDGHAGFDYRGLGVNQASINGSNDVVIHDQFVSVDSTVVRQFEFSTDVNNLLVNKGPSGWDHGCPNGGTISATATVTYTKDDAAQVVTNWNITMTFTDGTASITVSSGNVVWSYTKDVCIAIN